MPRRILCPLQTKVRRISFAKSCVTKSPEAEKAKTMEEIAPPKTPRCKHEKKIKNLMHKRHVKRTKYICVDLSFWRFQTSKHYFCISFFHCAQSLRLGFECVPRLPSQSCDRKRKPSHDAMLTLFAKPWSHAFLRVIVWYKIHQGSWYLHDKFMIFHHIGSYWFMLIHDWSCVHALCNAVAASFQNLLFCTWYLRAFLTAFSGSFAFSLIFKLDWSQSHF